MAETPIVEHPEENREETPVRKTAVRKTVVRKKIVRKPHPENVAAENRPAADEAPENRPAAADAQPKHAIAENPAPAQPEAKIPVLNESAPAQPAVKIPVLNETVPEKPATMLPWAILATVLCCLPVGIVAIIKASNVDSAWRRGDYEAAYAAAKDAKTWTIVAAVLGVVYFLFVLFSLAIS